MTLRLCCLLAVASMVAPDLPAQTRTAPDAAVLTKLLQEFLAGASRNDAAVHDRFWAEDLIYTRSAGRRIGKADIMKDLRARPAPKPGDPSTTYTAEDVRIQQYGDMAVVAFRLVGTTQANGRTETAYYLDTGVFRKRQGAWQAVSWQATRVPKEEEQAKKEVAAAEAALEQAAGSGDAAALESLLDEGFVWTHGRGEQTTRAQLLDQIRSGSLKIGKRETSDLAIAVSGDTAVVRGVSRPAPAGEAPRAVVFFTTTFANRSEGWRAAAIHTSGSE
jgi:ketosteroid isomerase-like protein